MQISQFLAPQSIFAGVAGGSKKRLLESIADHAHQLYPDLDAEDIFEGLIDRERLGSTGVGDGVAIPHCRLPGCDKIIGIFLTLSEPIDYDAPDKKPVDLVFALLVPEESAKDHLKALQGIVSLLGQPDIRDQLRTTRQADELFAILNGQPVENPS